MPKTNTQEQAQNENHKIHEQRLNQGIHLLHSVKAKKHKYKTESQWTKIVHKKLKIKSMH